MKTVQIALILHAFLELGLLECWFFDFQPMDDDADLDSFLCIIALTRFHIIIIFITFLLLGCLDRALTGFILLHAPFQHPGDHPPSILATFLPDCIHDCWWI